MHLVQSFVKHSIADEVRYSGIVIFFHPLAYDFRQCDCGADCVRTPGTSADREAVSLQSGAVQGSQRRLFRTCPSHSSGG